MLKSDPPTHFVSHVPMGYTAIGHPKWFAKLSDLARVVELGEVCPGFGGECVCLPAVCRIRRGWSRETLGPL